MRDVEKAYPEAEQKRLDRPSRRQGELPGLRHIRLPDGQAVATPPSQSLLLSGLLSPLHGPGTGYLRVARAPACRIWKL